MASSNNQTSTRGFASMSKKKRKKAGSLGGSKNTQAQQEARARNIEKAQQARHTDR